MMRYLPEHFEGMDLECGDRVLDANGEHEDWDGNVVEVQNGIIVRYDFYGCCGPKVWENSSESY